ncbi:MAG: biosynthetic-type acetolactate synthase large subunit [Treponema sp.]|nr:biosynthetic-type acetolactate synthase large subunit [Treponema sp.]
MMMSGARIVVECLAEQGVDTVFGFPGGSVIGIYDELYRNSDRIRHILTSHEQGAVHGADGYARASGKVGVVIATSGPGATNLVTGLATAYMDSVPLVAITGNVPTHLLGKDSFQEVDITGITMSITKHNFIVKDPAALASTLRRAFEIARFGRPGPVLVDIPKDITSASANWEPLPLSADKSFLPSPSRGFRSASDEEVQEAAAMIAASRSPFIVAGGGVIASGASDALRELAERIDAPVALTLMGQGAFPAGHPLHTGMVGMHGTRASNAAVRNSDLLIAVGTRFSDRVVSDTSSFIRNTQILHLDIDPAEIGKNVPCFHSLVGDVGELLSRLLPLLDRVSRPEWLARVDSWREDPPEGKASGGVAPRAALQAIRAAVPRDTIVTTEVGQHQIWTAQYFGFTAPRTFLSSGGLGTMGYGTGAAIGAQLARPDRQVVHIAGDGSFRMNFSELATMVHYGLPILVVVMNNGTLGMVRQWQTMLCQKRYAQTDLDRPPDFVKLADAFGIRAWRAEDLPSFRSSLAEALSESRPALIDLRIGIDEFVLPMVLPGKPIEEQIMEVVN